MPDCLYLHFTHSSTRIRTSPQNIKLEGILTLTADLTAYNALNYVEAKCVAKVVMSAENATQAASNLISSLNRYHSGQLAPKGQADAETNPEYTDN